jgi:hypothetical protein
VGNGKPSLGGLAEVGANFVEGLALGVTAGNRGNGGGVAASVEFWADNGGEDNGDTNGNGRSIGGGRLIVEFLLILVI